LIEKPEDQKTDNENQEQSIAWKGVTMDPFLSYSGSILGIESCKLSSSQNEPLDCINNKTNTNHIPNNISPSIPTTEQGKSLTSLESSTPRKIEDDIDLHFDFCWEETVRSKQTVFPVYNYFFEPPSPQKGPPPEGVNYTLRATKKVNMHPYPTLSITLKRDGNPWLRPEIVKVSTVERYKRKKDSEEGCQCGSEGIIRESQECQLNSEGIATVRNGKISFKKLQIGCVTSTRGHGVPLVLKFEFTDPRSLLFGQVVFSRPIEVGAKGPFALVYTQPKQGTEEHPTTKPRSSVSHSGEDRLRNLLSRYQLQRFLEVFLIHEVDQLAFECLTEESLLEMGVKRSSDRMIILNAVSNYLASGGSEEESSRIVSNSSWV